LRGSVRLSLPKGEGYGEGLHLNKIQISFPHLNPLPFSKGEADSLRLRAA